MNGRPPAHHPAAVRTTLRLCVQTFDQVLASPGVPETREYILRGMLKDDEIGVDSDVARIAWSGS